MLTIEERTASVSDFETVLVDLDYDSDGCKNRLDFNGLNFDIQIFPQRRNSFLGVNKCRETEHVFREHRITNEGDAIDSMLSFFVDSACGSESCQPLESILKTSRKRMSYPEEGKSQDDNETRRSVEFKGVVIREFGLALGDHPNAISGPPIRLDWQDCQNERHLDLNEYEEAREPRRNRRQMKISLKERHRILVHEQGHSFSEIKGAWKTALQIREQRIETSSQTLLQRKLEEVWESLCRKYGRFLDRTTSLCF